MQLFGWKYYLPIYLDTTVGGANVSSSQTDYPFTLHLTPTLSKLWSGIKSNGGDLRFRLFDGSPLDFEWEVWDYAGKDSWIHVKIPTVYGNQAGQLVRAYFGNDYATDGSNKEAVWDANYKAVYHLNQDKAEGAFDDSTSNNNDGTNNGSSDVAGQIDRGRNFDGINDNINLGNGSSFDLEYNVAHTLVAWIKVNEAKYNPIIAKEDLDADFPGWVFRLGTTGKIVLDLVNGAIAGNRYKFVSAVTIPADGNWYHVAATYGGASDGKIYKNGVLDGSASATVDNLTGSILCTDDCLIGELDVNNYYAKMDMDEVWVLPTTEKPADFVKLTYENQKTDQTLYTFGDIAEIGGKI